MVDVHLEIRSKTLVLGISSATSTPIWIHSKYEVNESADTLHYEIQILLTINGKNCTPYIQYDTDGKTTNNNLRIWKISRIKS